MNIMEELAAKAKKKPACIVFPEGDSPVIQKAAAQLQAQGLVRPILLGNPAVVQKQFKEQEHDPASVKLVDPSAWQSLDLYIDQYCLERDMPASVGKRIVTQPLCFAAMMVRNQDAGGMVAGIAHPTEDVLLACQLIIGLLPGISLASSFFVAQVPGFEGGEKGLLMLADPAVNPDPDPGELADIAITTADSARKLFGWEPRVAMLSFSTKGSASHSMVEKVVEATRLAREKAPDLLIDGELQADTALIPAVAEKKINGRSPVAGSANVLIFPDLNAANISVKILQRLAGAVCYGPMLQGFAKPVSDLSRGASEADITGAALMVGVSAVSSP